jgi:hypothetical protein
MIIVEKTKAALKSFVGFVRKVFGGKSAPTPITVAQSPVPVTKAPNQPIVSQGDFVSDFVYFGKRIVRPSSNVDWIQFDWVRPAMTICYSTGAISEYGSIWEYTFDNATEAIAIAERCARAASSGIFVWDELRERGPGKRHSHRSGVHARRIR